MDKEVNLIFKKLGEFLFILRNQYVVMITGKRLKFSRHKKSIFQFTFFLSRQATKSSAGKANFLIGFTCCHTIRITSGTNGSTEWKSLRVTFTNTTLAASGLTVNGWKYSSDKFFSADVASFGVACRPENIHLRVISSDASFH